MGAEVEVAIAMASSVVEAEMIDISGRRLIFDDGDVLLVDVDGRLGSAVVADAPRGAQIAPVLRPRRAIGIVAIFRCVGMELFRLTTNCIKIPLNSSSIRNANPPIDAESSDIYMSIVQM
jgi:hypothetical protein